MDHQEAEINAHLAAEVNERLSSVWGQIESDEGMALYELAGRVDPRLPIVELGTMQGRSLCFMMLGAMAAGHSPTVFAIDSWRRQIAGDQYWAATAAGGEENLTAFLHNIEEISYPSSVIHVEASTGEIAKVWHRPIGLLHIDADHSWDGIDGDYRGFAGWVGPGGLLALHDYRSGYDVLRYCDEVIKADPTWEDIHVTNTLLTARRAG